MSYLRSIHFQKNKEIFKLEELPLERYAESLGLPGAPKIKFLNKEIAKRKKNASHAMLNTKSVDVDEQSGSEESESEASDDSSDGDSESGEDDADDEVGQVEEKVRQHFRIQVRNVSLIVIQS